MPTYRNHCGGAVPAAGSVRPSVADFCAVAPSPELKAKRKAGLATALAQPTATHYRQLFISTGLLRHGSGKADCQEITGYPDSTGLQQRRAGGDRDAKRAFDAPVPR